MLGAQKKVQRGLFFLESFAMYGKLLPILQVHFSQSLMFERKEFNHWTEFGSFSGSN